MPLRLLLPLVLIVLAPATLVAEVHKYTDRNGRTHFVDSIDKIPAEYRDSAGTELPPISKVSPSSPVQYDGKAASSVQAATAIEVFVAEWCPHCNNLENFLKREKIRYTRYDIEKDAKGREEYQKMGGGVPITRIGSVIIRGNNPEAILAAAKKANAR